jgi:hypothetical protein
MVSWTTWHEAVATCEYSLATNEFNHGPPKYYGGSVRCQIANASALFLL